MLIGGILPPGDAGVASVAWLYGKLRHPAAGWQQWNERGRVTAVEQSRLAGAGLGGQSGFAQLLRRLLELPDYVAASIELAQFVAADVDSLA